MTASIRARLVSANAGTGGTVYAWEEPDTGRSGWLLFHPPSAFRACDESGAPTPEEMGVDLQSGEDGIRQDELLWRPFLQAAVAVFRRYRDDGTLPARASRTTY